jgi:hypothetical protein
MSILSRVPLTAVSSETTHLISTLLNPPKVIPSSNGLLRLERFYYILITKAFNTNDILIFIQIIDYLFILL